MSLSPHSETYWSRISWWIVRNYQMLIPSAVKICKYVNNVCKLLQLLGDKSPGWPTGASPPDPTGARPWTIAPKRKFLASALIQNSQFRWTLIFTIAKVIFARFVCWLSACKAGLLKNLPTNSREILNGYKVKLWDSKQPVTFCGDRNP